MSAADTDIALVRRFNRGDTDAFATLLARHRDRVFRLACVWLRDVQKAEDAAQEAFLRALTTLGGFRFRASVATYLYRMTKNVCSEMNRKEHQTATPERAADAASAEAEAVRDERVRAVRAALATLPERQRDVVLLRVFEDLSVKDTARVMGLRPGTVKAHLHKAIANLGKHVDLEEAQP